MPVESYLRINSHQYCHECNLNVDWSEAKPPRHSIHIVSLGFKARWKSQSSCSLHFLNTTSALICSAITSKCLAPKLTNKLQHQVKKPPSRYYTGVNFWLESAAISFHKKIAECQQKRKYHAVANFTTSTYSPELDRYKTLRKEDFPRPTIWQLPLFIDSKLIPVQPYRIKQSKLQLGAGWTGQIR